jgi:hypothetical protein
MAATGELHGIPDEADCTRVMNKYKDIIANYSDSAFLLTLQTEPTPFPGGTPNPTPVTTLAWVVENSPSPTSNPTSSPTTKAPAPQPTPSPMTAPPVSFVPSEYDEGKKYLVGFMTKIENLQIFSETMAESFISIVKYVIDDIAITGINSHKTYEAHFLKALK